MVGREIPVEDQKTYARVGYALLGGLWISIAVMVIGLVLVGIKGESVTRVVALNQVIPHLFQGDVRAVLDLGILLLFATPLFAVLVAFSQFLAHRDMPFVAVTAGLIIVLAAGFAVALHA